MHHRLEGGDYFLADKSTSFTFKRDRGIPKKPNIKRDIFGYSLLLNLICLIMNSEF